jgi:hypothetical protein
LAVKKSELGEKVNPQVFNHLRSILRSFFTWQIGKRHYPGVLGNPVVVKRIPNRGKGANPEHIIKPGDLQRWLDGVVWDDLPYLICTAILGIRPETVMRLSWENFYWDAGYVEIAEIISKCGKACPPLTDLVKEMLVKYRDCRGPVVVFDGTPERVRQVAKQLGIVKRFHNNARKSAISYTWKMLMEKYENEEKVETLMSEWFGNSQEVRRLYYKVKVTHPDAIAYFACTRVVSEVSLTPDDVENYRQRQILAFLRTHLEIAAKGNVHNPATTLDILENISEEVLKKAGETYPKASLPGFITISPFASRQIAPIKPFKRKTSRLSPCIVDELRTLLPDADDKQSYMTLN